MARLLIEHDNDDTLTLSQCGQHIVINIGQVESIIANLEQAVHEMRTATAARQQRDDKRRVQAWDSERRSFDALHRVIDTDRDG